MKKYLKQIILGLILIFAISLLQDKAAWAEEPEANYLTFTAVEDNSSVTFNFVSGSDVEYKLNAEAWAEYTKGTTISLNNKDDKVSFRGENVITDYDNHFSMEGKIAASGSVTSLTDGKGVDKNVTLTDECYGFMFQSCESLISAPELPAINLANLCYKNMFCECSSLKSTPELPATTLADYCYYDMFVGCSSLEEVASLPAEQLKKYCYSGMFYNCTNLVNAPSLSATELDENCYFEMFYGCSSLKNAPVLSATDLKKECYFEMFYGCSALESAPALPATTLAHNCYSSMFCGCSALENAPKLSATNLAMGCYSSMFSGCSSLKSAPDLPATTLKLYCYNCMFLECSSLETAPALPATTLESNCYTSMFYGCSSLVTVPDLPATTLVNNCYYKMFYGCTNLKISTEKNETLGITKEFSIPAYSGNNVCMEMFYEAGQLEGIPTDKRVPTTPPETGATYYAYAMPNVYSITYVLNGGTQAEGNPTEYTEGEGIKSFKTPTRIGYAFVGWYSDEEFKEEVKEITAESKGDITLYAKWEELSYKITYELNGGIQAEGNPTGYAYTVGVKSFKAPTRNGYTFAGWFEDAAFTREIKEISEDRKGDITLYAKWIKDPYTQKITVKNVTYVLSFDSNDNATNVVLSKFSDKKATSASISKVKYNGKSYNVTEIGDNAFKNNKKLKTVTIGSSVKIIGKAAFSGCTALTTVKSGSKVTEIKASAFNGCKKLKSFTLASSLKTIGSSAFTNCKALTKVTIGSKVNSIGSKAFKGCSALKSVTIKTTLLTDKNVGKEAFSGINSKATIKVPAKKLKDYTKLLKKKGIKGKEQKIKK